MIWLRAMGLACAFGASGPFTAAVARDDPAPTYARDIAPILQAKCQSCHRSGKVGPFALESYEQARKRAADIAAITEDRTMPPWMPTRGIGPPIVHDQSLTKAEIAKLVDWADAGAPAGDPSEMPPPRQFAEGWKLGPPDLVLEPSEDFTVPATGPDIYRCFVLPTNLEEDAYLEAIDYRPSNSAVVHHVISYIDTTGQARRLDHAEPGPGYTSSVGGGQVGADELGFWAAGSEPHRLPEGIGIRLPRGSDIILQVHYHPSGKAGADRTQIGLYFSRKPVKQALHWSNASNYNFSLKAGEANVAVKASWFVPVDVEALAVAPHMHQLGREMRMSVVFPDGREQDLIYIEDWDPSWQRSYYFREPIKLPAGSTVKVLAHFDNSDHPRNPNHPPKLVRYGPNAEDEMCVGYIAIVKEGQDLRVPRARDDLYEILIKQRMRQIQRHNARASR